ncbi:hypothetical protein Y88_0202 [Novosphingobium nitrogenifigens DSM 19370]|uniref:Thioredoxin-like fold domain-containing protein n=1 Tax=Novosphingobium nitrogenifigens DSM 19370 TaxID=983920 RepID=F1ZBF2_9SPHN|nr:thioredoxin domain-containing protein [Novosphingobium nitrogenifigens]EGD58150.1 hypothetical protein Y88_0202 [Novosphingobium nitrogenifigens DSM 19370]
MTAFSLLRYWPRLAASALAGTLALSALPVAAQNGAGQNEGGQTSGDPSAETGWQEAPLLPPIGKDDRLYGKADADFSLIVYLDPECPYCKVLGQQPEHVVDTSGGKVNLAVRLFPLPFHGPNAMLASTTALCVGDQAGPLAYYRFLDGWMAMTGSNGKGIGAGTAGKGDPVAELAATSGARNREALAECSVSEQTNQRLAREMRVGELAGVQGTPAIAIRDNRAGRTIMVMGAIGEADIKNAIAFLARVTAQAQNTSS